MHYGVSYAMNYGMKHKKRSNISAAPISVLFLVDRLNPAPQLHILGRLHHPSAVTD